MGMESLPDMVGAGAETLLPGDTQSGPAGTSDIEVAMPSHPEKRELIKKAAEFNRIAKTIRETRRGGQPVPAILLDQGRALYNNIKDEFSRKTQEKLSPKVQREIAQKLKEVTIDGVHTEDTRRGIRAARSEKYKIDCQNKNIRAINRENVTGAEDLENQRKREELEVGGKYMGKIPFYWGIKNGYRLDKLERRTFNWNIFKLPLADGKCLYFKNSNTLNDFLIKLNERCWDDIKTQAGQRAEEEVKQAQEGNDVSQDNVRQTVEQQFKARAKHDALVAFSAEHKDRWLFGMLKKSKGADEEFKELFKITETDARAYDTAGDKTTTNAFYGGLLAGKWYDFRNRKIFFDNGIQVSYSKKEWEKIVKSEAGNYQKQLKKEIESREDKMKKINKVQDTYRAIKSQGVLEVVGQTNIGDTDASGGVRPTPETPPTPPGPAGGLGGTGGGTPEAPVSQPSVPGNEPVPKPKEVEKLPEQSIKDLFREGEIFDPKGKFEEILLLTRPTGMTINEKENAIKEINKDSEMDQKEKEKLIISIDQKELISEDEKKIRVEQGRLAREEKLKLYDKQLIAQRRGLAECGVELEKKLESDDGVTREDLVLLIGPYDKKYGFTEKQKNRIGERVDSYIKMREKVRKFYEDNKSNPKELIKQLTGRELDDDTINKIKDNILRKGIALVIKSDKKILLDLWTEGAMATEAGEEKINNRKIHFGEKLGGFARRGDNGIPYVVIQSLESRVDDINNKRKNKKRKFLDDRELGDCRLKFQNILKHELQHAKDLFDAKEESPEKMLVEYEKEDDESKKEKLLWQYFRAKQEKRLDRAKKEILPSLHNLGANNLKQRVNELFLKKGDVYNFPVTINENMVSQLEKSDGKLYEKLGTKYDTIVPNAITALHSLVNSDIYPNETIIMLLKGLEDDEFPLVVWPKTMQRLLNPEGFKQRMGAIRTRNGLKAELRELTNRSRNHRAEFGDEDQKRMDEVVSILDSGSGTANTPSVVAAPRRVPVKKEPKKKGGWFWGWFGFGRSTKGGETKKGDAAKPESVSEEKAEELFSNAQNLNEVVTILKKKLNENGDAVWVGVDKPPEFLSELIKVVDALVLEIDKFKKAVENNTPNELNEPIWDELPNDEGLKGFRDKLGKLFYDELSKIRKSKNNNLPKESGKGVGQEQHSNSGGGGVGNRVEQGGGQRNEQDAREDVITKKMGGASDLPDLLRILKELGGELFGVWLQDGSQVNLYFSTLINRVEELMEDIADRKKDTGGDASDLSVPLEKKQWDWSGFRLYEFDKTAQRLFEKEIKEIEKPGKKN